MCGNSFMRIHDRAHSQFLSTNGPVLLCLKRLHNPDMSGLPLNVAVPASIRAISSVFWRPRLRDVTHSIRRPS